MKASFYLQQEEWDILTKIARASRTSRSAVVRALIRNAKGHKLESRVEVVPAKGKQ